MARVNIFLLLPETDPSNHWMRSTEKDFSEVQQYITLIRELKEKINRIRDEKYAGFYDGLNIKNFISWYETLDEYYPPLNRTLRRILQENEFNNWREDILQLPINNCYKIFAQSIENSTICIIAEQKNKIPSDHYALLNHQACVLKTPIEVSIQSGTIIAIDSLSSEDEMFAWFAKNRLPQRRFNLNPKHGENRQQVKQVCGESVSPLRCSAAQAQLLLEYAIGDPDRELYNFDPNYDEIIVFKYEGPTPQNMYHAYHVAKNSGEVPAEIRKKLNR